MEAIRKILDAERILPIIDLPDHMRNRQVEVIILPVDEEKGSSGKSMKGFLRRYANPDFIALEKQAWAEVVEEQYDRT